MIKQFLLSALVGGSLFVGGDTARADHDDHDHHGHHRHGNHHRYGGHYDYIPGHYHRHGDHYDYYPGEYQYHRGSHHGSHYGSYRSYRVNPYGLNRIPYGVPPTGYYGGYYNRLRPSTLGLPQYGAYGISPYGVYGVPRSGLSIQIGR